MMIGLLFPLKVSLVIHMMIGLLFPLKVSLVIHLNDWIVISFKSFIGNSFKLNELPMKLLKEITIQSSYQQNIYAGNESYSMLFIHIGACLRCT